MGLEDMGCFWPNSYLEEKEKVIPDKNLLRLTTFINYCYQKSLTSIVAHALAKGRV